MTDVAEWGSADFPAGQGFDVSGGLRLYLRRRAATVLAATTGAAFAITAGLSAAYIHHEKIILAQEATVAHEQRANADLQDALAQMRDQVAAVSQALGLAQRQIAALGDQTQRQLAASEQVASNKTDRITQLAHALEQAQHELQQTEEQRVTLMARLSLAETASRDQYQKKIQELTADRDRAASERDQLRARISELDQKASMAHQAPHVASQQPAAVRPLADAAPAAGTAQRSAVAAPPAAEPERQVALVVPRTAPSVAVTPAVAVAPSVAPATAAETGRMMQVERVLASAGVDVKRLFADFGARSDLGGPFVPMPKGGMPENHFSAAKLAALPGLVKSLPLAVPMSNYRETSPFGEREDPFNGRPAFHPGIDLAAPYGEPIYATAPGVVTFAGWSGGYGKIVEIDHGHGIVSRYGHLARYAVVVGEHVAAGTQIGYEGSTGRSTGPHLIYEIDVNGEPQDPAKFMNLAHLIPVAAR